MSDPLDGRDLEAINREFENLKEILSRIEEKQDYTNGRVRELEKANIFSKGFMAAFGFIFGFPAFIATCIGIFLALRELQLFE